MIIKLNFQQLLLLFQCHMIFQKSIVINYYYYSIINNGFYYQYWKPFLLLNIFVENVLQFVPQDSLMKR